jgi:hypothetical protein
MKGYFQGRLISIQPCEKRHEAEERKNSSDATCSQYGESNERACSPVALCGEFSHAISSAEIAEFPNAIRYHMQDGEAR